MLGFQLWEGIWLYVLDPNLIVTKPSKYHREPMSIQKWANTNSNIVTTHMVFNDQLSSMSYLIRPPSEMHKPIGSIQELRPFGWAVAAAQIDNFVKALVSNGRVCQQHNAINLFSCPLV